MIDIHLIAEAVAILKRGGLVAFPTETVYGLGADASNPVAVRRIYAVKGRPSAHPVIVHLASAAQLQDWSRDVNPMARLLADRFWPGPLTLVLNRARGVDDVVTGGQDTIGLRVPSHPVALQLLRAFGGGIAAPSANRFGRISATSAEHVREELGQDVDLILDGGTCEIGIESTIIDARGDQPVILRPGRITSAQIEQVVGTLPSAPDHRAPRVSGALAAHYAPATPLYLMNRSALEHRATRMLVDGKRVAILAFKPIPNAEQGARTLVASSQANLYAHDLYANLRSLDTARCDAILVEAPPLTPEWLAVNDRLKRAAAGSTRH